MGRLLKGVIIGIGARNIKKALNGSTYQKESTLIGKCGAKSNHYGITRETRYVAIKFVMADLIMVPSNFARQPYNIDMLWHNGHRMPQRDETSVWNVEASSNIIPTRLLNTVQKFFFLDLRLDEESFKGFGASVRTFTISI